MDKETMFEYIQRLKLAVITLFKWLFCSVVCGCFIGSVGAVFHLMLGYVGSLRVEYPFLLFGLPVAGIIIVFVLAAVLTVVFRDSRWGYETLVIGSNPTAARYAGINIPRNVLLVMLLSGAVCGMGGMIEVSGIVGKLQPGISPGYGYTAIIVAWLARLHPAAIIVVAFLFAIIHVGGFMVQTLGIPSAVATMLQGAILFFVVGADIFTNYQLRLIKNEGGEESE